MDKIENLRGGIHSVTTLHEMMVRLFAEGKEQDLLRHHANEHRIEELTKRIEVILQRMTSFDDTSGKMMVDLYTIQTRFEDAIKTNEARWTLGNGRDDTLHATVAINSAAISRLSTEAQCARELMDKTFQTSEKAIEKSETAQREYNTRSNEFRGQLDDQAKRLMPREETMTMFRASEDKMAGFATQVHTRVDGIANQFDARIAAVVKDLDQLKALTVLDQGKAQGAENTGRIIMAGVGLLATLIAICTGVLLLTGR